MFELAPVSGCREASRTDSRLASVACTLSAPYDENEDKVVDQASNIENDQLYSLGRNDMICLEIVPHGVSLVISSDMPPLPRIYSHHCNAVLSKLLWPFSCDAYPVLVGTSVRC